MMLSGSGSRWLRSVLKGSLLQAVRQGRRRRRRREQDLAYQRNQVSEVLEDRTLLTVIDFGDAPDSYSTLLASDGPRHLLSPLNDPLQLGFTVNAEVDGQPSPNASDAFDDDGLGFFSIPAGNAGELEVYVSGNSGSGGVLDAWLDYNKDGDFADAGEQIFVSTAVSDGFNLLNFNVPTSAAAGPSILRLRLSSAGGLGFDGSANDGEVEDYEVFVDRFEDFGDAPDSYSTLLASDGPRHLLSPLNDPLRLGGAINPELDGQPSPNASDAFDDDGLGFFSIPAGNAGELEVYVSGNSGSGGVLDAWLDYNLDGDFADAGEQIFVSTSVTDGFNLLNFNVPNSAQAGPSILRLRLSSTGGLGFDGSADDGEVEDYEVFVDRFEDFGDAPDSYSTLLASAGPRHLLSPLNDPLRLGGSINPELDGQPSPNASDAFDDDGLGFFSIPAGNAGELEVYVSGNSGSGGVLDAWLDYNLDGDFADAGEQIFVSTSVTDGFNLLNFNVPTSAQAGLSILRLRLSSTGGLGFDGSADDGEVEDYEVFVDRFEDFGDAPDSYSTLLASAGPRHLLSPLNDPLRLGGSINPELDGQPSPNASDAFDDDGLGFFSIPAGNAGELEVYVSGNSGSGGVLDAWLDYNLDGDFADAGEQIFVSTAVTDGFNLLNFNVPTSAQAGPSILRLRLSSAGGLGFDGSANDGEVEDYEVFVDRFEDFGDAPDSYSTLLASDGPRHLLSPLNDPLRLGGSINPELDGQPSPNASDAFDDDGLGFFSIPAGNAGELEVYVSGNSGSGGVLDAWLDYNQDGDFADAGEQIFVSTAVTDGFNLLSFNVPTSVQAGPSILRLRLSSAGGLGFDGSANDGEVEDYEVFVEAPELSLTILDSAIGENGGLATAVVTRSLDTTNPLTVTLSSNDTSEATVPEAVTIPAGQDFVYFTITGIDDGVVDGTQTATVSVSAIGFIGDSDALDIVDDDTLALTLGIASSSISENGGSATGTVTRNDADLSSELVVTLASGDTTEATVPATVTIPVGQSSVDFAITAVDDAVVDGTQVLSISSMASGYVGYSTGLNVTDDDTLALTLGIAPSSISENGGTATGTVTRNDADLSSELVVTLASGDITEATVPETVTIPVGQSSVDFAVTAVDDAIVDGTQVLSISSMASGYVGYSTGLNVTDDDTLALTLGITPISISENGGTATGAVTRNDGDLSSELVVNLASDDTTEATVPATIIIPIGQASTNFNINAVDDLIFDGMKVVGISASSTSYTTGAAALSVTDDDSLGLSLSLVSTSISEAGGNTNAIVTLDSALEADLVVNLSSSDLTAATVPATITIPAGQMSGVFLVSGVDDNVVDGTQTATITVDAPGVGSDSEPLDVTDNDVSSLSIYPNVTSISENGGTATGTAQLTTPLSTDLVVALTSSDTTEATVPASVTILAGDTTAAFVVTGVDDLIDDEAKTVTISANSALNSDTFDIIVSDDDVAQFAFSIAESTVDENGGVATGTVSLTHTLENDLIIDLTANTPGVIDFPAQVTIPAGTLLSDFSITGVDDNVDRNDRLMTITATSVRGVRTDQLTVVDDDTATLSLTIDATEISENGGSATATLSLSTPYFNSFFLTLSSNDTSEATVLANVFVAAESTSATFTITAVDDTLLDGTQTVIVTGTSILGNVSASIDITSDDVNQPPIGTPVIQGSAEENETLTADTSSISDADGLGAFSYEWLRDGVTISGATADSYALTSADVGSQISVAVSYTDGNGTAEGPLTSAPTATVTSAASWFDLAFEDFEGGFGTYTDGGNDARLYTGGVHSHQGSNSANLQDNSGSQSAITLTDALELDTPDYTGLRVEFWFKAVSFESGEDFFLEYSDGSGWQTIGVWARGTDFQNNQFSFASVEVSEQDVTFSDDARIRLRADASGNRDDVYIDEIRIQAFGVPPVNDPPAAQDDSATVMNDTSVVISVLDNDSDPDGDTLVVDSFSQASNGSVSDNGDGTLTYTPAAGFVGTDSFTYTISDGKGGTAKGTVTGDVTAPVAWTDLAFEDFENGFGTYTDGGNDAKLYTGGTLAHQGNNAVNLQDNSGTASSITLTNSLDLATPSYAQLRVEFWFQAVSFESGEDFFLQYFDGNTWQTISVFTRGVDFENNEFNFASVEISSQDYAFSSNAKIRLMADASGNGDDVYIDEILISAR